MPWLTPKSLPDTCKCLVLFIPDDIDVTAIVSGLLEPLTYPDNWTQSDGGITTYDAARAFDAIWNIFLDQSQDCSGCT